MLIQYALGLLCSLLDLDLCDDMVALHAPGLSAVIPTASRAEELRQFLVQEPGDGLAPVSRPLILTPRDCEYLVLLLLGC